MNTLLQEMCSLPASTIFSTGTTSYLITKGLSILEVELHKEQVRES